MSVKKDSSGRRSVQVEVEVPGTPEEVWKAIATGPGVSSWFVPTEMEGRLGGKITCHFGPGMDSTSTITSWEPPVRFATEDKWLGENAPLFATEWFVEARSGGVCVVRVIHSLFAETDDWDDQLEGTETGWPLFFRVLRMYLTRFRGMRVGSVIATGLSTEPESKAWEKLTAFLGLSSMEAGAHFQTGSGVPPLSGTVEGTDKKSPPSITLELDQPASGIGLLSACTHAGSVMLSMSLYFFGDIAEDVAKHQESAWQAWINERFPAPVPSTQ